ncbi:uncharacterized protein LOC117172522 [Belonocnema kinseyi]|uniref:uncharacterized protein LOC117172522 n=1 Tax=Belonocnema kinseyi TaxID=2817044 RepID=UPI00143CCB31|nr:uncharacterized protein LOC117172522 [Belonocnema kinseyi]XP_033216434.1 uncharacterized protein LOC117172522 [Belonocnema kinseyi]XP_033216436.1 uncharacterized protein LOC117172522 [Belonocnema kinseyi]
MMPTMPPDNHQISLKVIEAVKQHPVLYISEVKSSVIKLQEFRQKVWKRISDELGLDSGWVKLRWKNLRDTYCRILKYKNKAEKGIRRKKWIFEDHLGFLKFPYEPDFEPQCVVLSDEYVQDINCGGLSCDDLLEQLEDRDEDYSEYLELEETAADPISAISRNEAEIATRNLTQTLSESPEPVRKKPDVTSYAQEIESKYRKIRPKRVKLDEPSPVEINNYNIQTKNSASIQENLENSIFLTSPTTNLTQYPINNKESEPEEEVEEENEDEEKQIKSGLELFFDSMAQTVKKLPSKVQADIKLDICRIVTEAEVRFSKRLLEETDEETGGPDSGLIPKLVLIPCSMIDKQKK